MQFIDGHKHLGYVESGILFLKHAGIIHQCTEVASGNIFHSQVDELAVLKGVKKTDKPWCPGGSQDIALNEDVSYLRTYVLPNRAIVETTRN